MGSAREGAAGMLAAGSNRDAKFGAVSAEAVARTPGTDLCWATGAAMGARLTVATALIGGRLATRAAGWTGAGAGGNLSGDDAGLHS